MKLFLTENEKKRILGLHKNVTPKSILDDVDTFKRLFNFNLNESKLKKFILNEDLTVIAPVLSSDDQNFLKTAKTNQGENIKQVYQLIYKRLVKGKIFFNISQEDAANIISIIYFRKQFNRDNTYLKYAKGSKWDDSSIAKINQAQTDSANFMSEAPETYTLGNGKKDPSTVLAQANVSPTGFVVESSSCQENSLLDICRMMNTHNLLVIFQKGTGNVFSTPDISDDEKCLNIENSMTDESNLNLFGLKTLPSTATATSEYTLPYEIKPVGKYFEFAAKDIGVPNTLDLNEANTEKLIDFLNSIFEVANVDYFELFFTTSTGEKLQTPYKTEDEYYEVLKDFPDLDANTTKNKQYPLPQYFSATSANGTIITEKNYMTSYNGFLAFKKANTFRFDFNYNYEVKPFVSDSYSIGSVIVRFSFKTKNNGQKTLESLKYAISQTSGSSDVGVSTFEYYSTSF
jgi:hypothetical protein